MKYRNSIIALGFLVVIIQFLGFPENARNALFIISGIVVVALAYLAGKK